MTDRKTQDAVIRNLEIIGEAVKRLSPSLTSTPPRRAVAGVDLDLVWGVIEYALPTLRQKVDAALA